MTSSHISACGIPFLVLLAFALGCNGSRTNTPSSVGVDGKADVRLVDITDEAGLSSFRHDAGVTGEKWMPETVGSGGGFLDYDGDGHLDVVLVAGGSLEAHPDESRQTPALRLYRNAGGGAFDEVTQQVGLGEVRAYGMGVAAVDYDNDGDDDIFLTTVGQDLLFRNDGGTFVEVGDKAGIAGPSSFSTAAIFIDADRDGYADLFVGSYVEWSPETDIRCSFDGKTKTYCTPEAYAEASSRFYRNNRDGTFSESTQASGFGSEVGKVLGVAEDDFNGDGWPDLVVARDLVRTLLYINNGDGTFTEDGLAAGVAFDNGGNARAGMGIDSGVVDSSYRPTIFIGNFSNETVGVYRSTGSGFFKERAAASQLGSETMKTLTFGLILIDVDHDSDLDLFLANGHVQPEIEQTQDVITYRQQAQLFLNSGEGRFDASPARGVLGEHLVARGLAAGDIDNDGDADLLVTENNGPVHLWRNDGASGNYLRVALAGIQSHPSGLGSRIVALIGDRRFERRIRTGSSYLSQSEQVATFGLGNASGVDSLLIFWASGEIDRLGPVSGNKEILVREGSSQWTAEKVRID